MDVVALILTTLGAGAASAAQETAGDAVREAYAALKALIKRRFGGKQVAETALEQYEQDPATWEAPLRKELDKAGLAEDDEVVAAANRLEQALAAAGVAVTAAGARSVAVGRDISRSTIITGDQNRIAPQGPSEHSR